MYQYDWIPLYSVAALTAIEVITYVSKSHKVHFNFPHKQEEAGSSI
jgi:hypothetical protein